MKGKFGIKEVVALGIGTALFVVLTNAQIPLVIVPNTALQVRMAILRLCLVELGFPRGYRWCGNRLLCQEVCSAGGRLYKG